MQCSPRAFGIRLPRKFRRRDFGLVAKGPRGRRKATNLYSCRARQNSSDSTSHSNQANTSNMEVTPERICNGPETRQNPSRRGGNSAGNHQLHFWVRGNSLLGVSRARVPTLVVVAGVPGDQTLHAGCKIAQMAEASPCLVRSQSPEQPPTLTHSVHGWNLEWDGGLHSSGAWRFGTTNPTDDYDSTDPPA